MFQPGTILRHYKGGEYIVLMLSQCSETKEEMITYQSLSTEQVWTRPAKMFTEKAGEETRFTKLEDPPEFVLQMELRDLAQRIRTFQRSQLPIARTRAIQHAIILFEKVKNGR